MKNVRRPRWVCIVGRGKQNLPPSPRFLRLSARLRACRSDLICYPLSAICFVNTQVLFCALEDLAAIEHE